MNPQYPAGLPRGLHSNRTYQLVDPLQRTSLSSGRARQRRRFTDVPELAQISWIFSSVQGQAFEGWWRDVLRDGALWFDCPLETPLGYFTYEARFTGVYSGPSRIGPKLWGYSAELELKERAVVPIGEGEFPDDILYSEIFDLTVNREWPLAIERSTELRVTPSGETRVLPDGEERVA